MLRFALPLLAAVSTLGPLSSVASATSSNGGIAAPGRPSIELVTCSDGQTGACARGASLTISGGSLQAVRTVTFLGRAGRADDRSARPAQRHDDAIVVTVPAGTRSGPVAVASSTGTTRGPRVRITTAITPSGDAAGDAPATTDRGVHVFPIRGAHDYGTFVNQFGGGRGHQGQDVLAACGTPLVAATSGEVIHSAFDGRAGNYVVILRADDRSEVYMHMRGAAIVSKGDSVTAGQRIGEVGETGHASACHLHFESWTAPGWYRGGEAVDPLPQLRGWDASA